MTREPIDLLVHGWYVVTMNADRDIIRNARRQLDLGDVQGAAEAITSVSGNAGAAFKSWQAQAQQRAALDASLRDLNARLLETAASGGSAG